ncbi:hypothetical protein GCM10022236_34110 [Microlunatus ginsengisoli]|uniref:Uncharacterized protein n=1 Tax=Microlunatus ginsengisoli TaxID=363863 RepID=A0ABP7ABK7_9ACTN
MLAPNLPIDSTNTENAPNLLVDYVAHSVAAGWRHAGYGRVRLAGCAMGVTPCAQAELPADSPHGHPGLAQWVREVCTAEGVRCRAMWQHVGCTAGCDTLHGTCHACVRTACHQDLRDATMRGQLDVPPIFA